MLFASSGFSLIPVDDVFSKANGCCTCNGQRAVAGTNNKRKAIRKEKTDIGSEMLQFENLHRRKNGDYRPEASPFYLSLATLICVLFLSIGSSQLDH